MAGQKTIAVLDVSLRARTKKFESGMKRARKTLTRFRKSIPGVNLLLNKFTALASAAGVAGLAYLIKKEAEAIDATAKLAERVGIGTEALVGLQHAANQTGVETGDLSKGLEMLARRIGETIDGTGEAKEQFEKMGLSANDLAGMSLDKAFERVAHGIASMASESEQAAAAADIFGRSGVKLVLLLRQGPDAIRAFREEARKLGLTFTEREGKNVQDFVDAMDRLRKVFTGVLRRSVIELAPYFEAIAEAFTEWATSGEGIGVKMARVFDGVYERLSDISRVFSEILLTMLKMKRGFIVTSGIAKKRLGTAYVPESAVWAEQILAQAGKGKYADSGVAELNKTIKRLEEQIARGVSPLEVLAREVKRKREGAPAAGMTWESPMSLMPGGRPAPRAGYNPWIETAPGKMGAIEKAWYARRGGMFPKGVDFGQYYQHGQFDFGAPARDMSDLKYAGESALGSIEQGFAGAIFGAQKFSDALRGIIGQLGQIAFSMAFRQIIQWVGQGISTAFSAGGSGSGTGGIDFGQYKGQFGFGAMAHSVLPATTINTGIQTSGDVQRNIANIGGSVQNVVQLRSR